MDNIPIAENCETQFIDGTSIVAVCDGRYIQQPFANMCQRIYYANGSLKCIPNGSYHAVCKNIYVDNNRELVAECRDGQGSKTVLYDMSKWRGQSLVYTGGMISHNDQGYQVRPSSINATAVPAPVPRPCKWLQGDCLFDDLPNGVLSQTTPDNCEAECRKRDDCRFCVTSPEGECFLKGGRCLLGRGDDSKQWCMIRR